MGHALQVSSDVYFYTLGLRMWETNQLQNWAGKLGIGRQTGLDIPVRPKPKDWCRAGSGATSCSPKGLTDRPWSAGDNIQLAIGQGDLQTNPLQMAIAYAALANGGTIVTPHLGMEVEDAAGRVLKEFEPKPRRQLKSTPATAAAILEGLHQAAQDPGGTSSGVFGGFPIDVAGKTGTAEREGQGDQSWFAVARALSRPAHRHDRHRRGRRLRSRIRGPVVLGILEAISTSGRLGSRRAHGGSRMTMYATRTRKPDRSHSRSRSASASGSGLRTWTGR